MQLKILVIHSKPCRFRFRPNINAPLRWTFDLTACLLNTVNCTIEAIRLVWIVRKGFVQIFFLINMFVSFLLWVQLIRSSIKSMTLVLTCKSMKDCSDVMVTWTSTFHQKPSKQQVIAFTLHYAKGHQTKQILLIEVTVIIRRVDCWLWLICWNLWTLLDYLFQNSGKMGKGTPEECSTWPGRNWGW